MILSFLSACGQNCRVLLSASHHEMSINGVQFFITEPLSLSSSQSVDMQMGPEESLSVNYKFALFSQVMVP